MEMGNRELGIGELGCGEKINVTYCELLIFNLKLKTENKKLDPKIGP